ncbi:MAG: DUF421 domain-containing protein [Bacillota bacterium]
MPLYVPAAKSVVLVAAGFLLLRLAGRKSISQMTIGQTVVMIAIGSIIIEPIVTQRIPNTLVAALTFVLFLIATEFLELRFALFEDFLSGRAKAVIADGELQEDTLRNLRLTVDKLEMRLRQQGIQSIADVETATLEPNGQLGYELKRTAQPLTVGEFEQAMARLFGVIGQPLPDTANIFDEAKAHSHLTDKPQNLE